VSRNRQYLHEKVQKIPGDFRDILLTSWSGIQANFPISGKQFQAKLRQLTGQTSRAGRHPAAKLRDFECAVLLMTGHHLRLN